MTRTDSSTEKKGLRLLRQATKIPRLKTSRQAKALIQAIVDDQTELAVWLLKHGVDPNCTDSRKRNVLWLAAYWSREELVRELLKRGATLADDVLMVPVVRHNERIVRWLVKRGANVNCVARDPDQVQWDPRKRVLLTEALASAAKQPILRKSRTGKRSPAPEAIPLILIRAGAKVNRLILERPFDGSENRSMIGLAACYGLLKTVRAMIAAGADVDLRDNRGRTPLFDAASQGHLSVAQELLRAGARKDLTDFAGLTPLEVVRQQEHSPAMIHTELFISAGGKVGRRRLDRERAWQRRRGQMSALLEKWRQGEHNTV